MSTKEPTLLEERRATHGRYDDFANLEQGLQQTFFNNSTVPMTATQRSAVNMILHKLARIGTGDPSYIDHWDDIAGYAQRGKGDF